MRGAIRQGVKNRNELLRILSDWMLYNPHEELIVSFVGLRITTSCNVIGKDKCIYCDQKFVTEKLTPYDIMKFFREIYDKGVSRHFYVSISGGEPLLWGKKLYGKDGIIHYLARQGTYVNMNSDLQLVNTDNCVDIIQSGLSSLRFSFDISDELLFNEITTPGAFKRTLFSVFLLSKMKEISKTYMPKMFVNVVATKVNVNHYEELTDFLIDFCKTDICTCNPDLISSLCNMHLIPLGGERNKWLLPSYEDWEHFLNITIPRCKEKWDSFFSEMRTENTMFDFFSFANPLDSDMYKGSREEVLGDFVNQNYARHTNRFKCYTAPTQLYILPNGDAYPCTHHAENQTHSIGNIFSDSFAKLIQKNLSYLNCLPNEFCEKCPLNAVKLNVKMQERLLRYIDEILNCSGILESTEASPSMPDS